MGTPQDSTPGVWDVGFYGQVLDPPPAIGRFESDVHLSQNLSGDGAGVHFRGFVGRQREWGDAFASAWEMLSLLGLPESERAEMGDCTEVVVGVFL